MGWHDVVGEIEWDGRIFAEVGPWAEEKHRLLAHYATLFVRSMRDKWDDLVYLDLFSGPGACRIRGSNRFYRSSPTIVFGLEQPFTSYIFCDADAGNVEALQARLSDTSLSRKFDILHGDVNILTGEVLRRVPRGDSRRKVLSFCFLDPYKLANLKFTMVRALAERYMDFLVLIPSGMDAHRNVGIYAKDACPVVDEFLGNTTWRARWQLESVAGVPFEQFIVSEFTRSMSELEYLDPGLENIVTIRSQDKNLLLYRLALYSRHKLGSKFWRETRKYTNPQTGWDF